MKSGLISVETFTNMIKKNFKYRGTEILMINGLKWHRLSNDKWTVIKMSALLNFRYDVRSTF